MKTLREQLKQASNVPPLTLPPLGQQGRKQRGQLAPHINTACPSNGGLDKIALFGFSEEPKPKNTFGLRTGYDSWGRFGWENFWNDQYKDTGVGPVNPANVKWLAEKSDEKFGTKIVDTVKSKEDAYKSQKLKSYIEQYGGMALGGIGLLAGGYGLFRMMQPKPQVPGEQAQQQQRRAPSFHDEERQRVWNRNLNAQVEEQ